MATVLLLFYNLFYSRIPFYSRKNPPKSSTSQQSFVNKDEVCPVCCEVVKDDERALQCEGECSKWYHCGCAGLSRSFYDGLADDDTWTCATCKGRSVSEGGTLTMSHDFDELEPNNGRESTKECVPEVSTLNLEGLNPAIKLVALKLNEIITAISALKDSVVFQSKQFDTFNLEMKNMKQENARIMTKFDGIEESNKRLKDENDLLTVKMNALEQALISNELEINGIPETPNENPVILVRRVCEKLNCTLDERDVLGIYRPRVRNERKVNSNNAPIVVVLQNRFVRQRIVESKKAYGTLTCRDIEFRDTDGRIADKKIYVNEKLTQTNKHLFWLARKTKDIGYKYCWVKNGYIFVKYTDNSKPLLITRESDIPVKAPGRMDASGRSQEPTLAPTSPAT